MKRIIVLVVLVGIIAGGIYAVKTLPWWAVLVGFVGFVFIAKFAIKHLLKKLFLAPFKAKGGVLKGATATIHSVAPAGSPEPAPGHEPPEDEPATSPAPRDHYLLDVTITPQEPKGPFRHWSPGELNLVKPESVLRPESDEADDQDESCEVLNIEALENGGWVKDDGLQYAGPQRLKLLLGVRPGVNRLKFRYYFEEFGEVSFREAPTAAVARN